MMTRLSSKERDQMEVLLHQGFSIRAIARKLGRYHTVILYELKVRKMEQYDAKKAHAEALALRSSSRMKCIFTQSRAMRNELGEKRENGWSVEQVMEGRRLEGKTVVHKNTIYKHGKKQGWWQQRKYKKHPGKREKVLPPLPKDFGTWELDTICFERTQWAVLVLHETKTKYSVLWKVRRNKPIDTIFMLKQWLASHKGICKKIVRDHGEENGFLHSDHIDIPIEVCDKAKPYQKPHVENHNGLLRHFFPWEHDIENTSQGEIERVQELLNLRRRKGLCFATPKEVFAQCTHVEF